MIKRNRITPNARICLLLAGSDLTVKEIRAFVSSLKPEGAGQQLEKTIVSLRQAAARAQSKRPAEDEDGIIDGSYLNGLSRASRKAPPGGTTEPSAQVQELLLEGTGLSEEEALQRLLEVLEGLLAKSGSVKTGSFIQTGDPIRVQESFRRTIESLNHFAPYPLLLQAAAMVRNSIQAPRGWALRDLK